MKFHVVFEDQQGLVFPLPCFAHGLQMTHGTTVCSRRVAPVRRGLDHSSVHGVPTCHFDLMLLELRLRLGPAVRPSRKIDADLVWKASVQRERLARAVGGLSRSHVGISQRHFPLRPNNVPSAAHTGTMDRNWHPWDGCPAATFHSRGGPPLS